MSSARILGLGLKPYPSNMLNKDNILFHAESFSSAKSIGQNKGSADRGKTCNLGVPEKCISVPF